jgi:hypothetical protein
MLMSISTLGKSSVSDTQVHKVEHFERQGKDSLDEITKSVLANASSLAVLMGLAILIGSMRAALYFEHSHFGAGLNQRFLKKSD